MRDNAKCGMNKKNFFISVITKCGYQLEYGAAISYQLAISVTRDVGARS